MMMYYTTAFSIHNVEKVQIICSSLYHSNVTVLCRPYFDGLKHKRSLFFNVEDLLRISFSANTVGTVIPIVKRTLLA